ncbi:hypothetical protein KR032_009334 [Drosophila birchii]|nr:hypothetical protein KR032_009334 [Drosophila birchii]
MELKVWVEGIQRIVCGVTVNTTCQDVVFALAHATGKVGRFTLIERWRNNERHLAPNENPMKLLLKWGEYANDVQFILQRSENKTQQQPQQQQQQQQQQQSNNNTYAVMTTKKPLTSKPAPPALQKQKSNVELSYRTKELKKSFGGYDAKQFDNIGIVKGIPQQQQQQSPQQVNQQPATLVAPTVPPPDQLATQDNNMVTPLVPKHEKSLSNPLDMTSTSHNPPIVGYNDFYNNNNSLNSNHNNINNINNNINNSSNQHIYSQLSKSSNELRRSSPSNDNIYYTNNNNNSINNNNNNSPAELYKQTPTISANGALVPPPYRDPPPPRNSPMCQGQRLASSNADTMSNASSSTNPFLSDYEQHSNHNNNNNNASQAMDEGESMFQATQYNDLLQLIKFQREKITAQQMELQKFDTEIVFLESKERDHAHELEAISREISKADQIFRQGSEQLQTLQYVEEENELVKQQEKTLKSEIALLRSKLANCETELLQCKNKMRLLMDDIELEQQQQQQTNRQTVERDFLMEMERIQSEIDQALHNTDTSNKTADSLKKELLMIEHAIAEKKRQVEQLVNEMKEVNLQSLTVTTTAEEIKHLLEGQQAAPGNKQGSSRRIIGSPRQLETAVPTSKNPHGVWV